MMNMNDVLMLYLLPLVPILILLWLLALLQRRLNASAGFRRLTFILLATLMCAPVMTPIGAGMNMALTPNVVALALLGHRYVSYFLLFGRWDVPSVLITAMVVYLVGWRIPWGKPRSDEAAAKE